MKLPWDMPQKRRVRILIPTLIVWVGSLILQNIIKEPITIAIAALSTLWFQAFSIFIIFDNSRQTRTNFQHEIDREEQKYRNYQIPKPEPESDGFSKNY